MSSRAGWRVYFPLIFGLMLTYSWPRSNLAALSIRTSISMESKRSRRDFGNHFGIISPFLVLRISKAIESEVAGTAPVILVEFLLMPGLRTWLFSLLLLVHVKVTMSVTVEHCLIKTTNKQTNK